MPFTAADLGREDFAAYVLEHISRDSVLLNSGARRINIAGTVAHVPRVLTDGTASWTGEATEITSDAPTADEMLLTPKGVKNLAVLSNESIDDVEADVLTAVGDALTRSIARAVDVRAFSNSAATAIAPVGLMNASVLGGIAVSGTVNIATIRARVAALSAAGAVPNAVYVHATDYAALDAQSDTTGRGLLVPDPTQPGAQTIGGARIYVAPFAAAGTAIIAETGQINVGVRKDARVDFSADAKFTADSVVARVVARLDWAINDLAGISVIKP
jgi:HK97 family phage major capsid protein